jgi:hypothetical protein
MLQPLKPTEAAIEELALAETDPAQHARFAPVRWGWLGNLLLIGFAGALGLVHATLAAAGRRVLPPKRNVSG